MAGRRASQTSNGTIRAQPAMVRSALGGIDHEHHHTSVTVPGARAFDGTLAAAAAMPDPWRSAPHPSPTLTGEPPRRLSPAFERPARGYRSVSRPVGYPAPSRRIAG